MSELNNRAEASIRQALDEQGRYNKRPIDFALACTPKAVAALLAELDAARTRASEAERDAQRYVKWRALFLTESDNDSMLALMDAWTLEAVDAAIDLALAASHTPASEMKGSE